MKIASIQTVRLNLPAQITVPEGWRPSWAEHAEVANPMSRYAHVKRQRAMWLPRHGDAVWCKVTAEDGTWGLGLTDHGPAVAAIVDGHLAPQLIGQECLATERLADMMFRLTKPYGTVGLASYAISAVDLALWDLKGKLLGKPVYTLLGGPARDRMFCYATGNDIDWYLELGFRAFKLACPYGPADGLDGLRKNEEFVAQAREQIGDACELMLDCWMAFDVDYTVRLAETLRPYKLRWLEECLILEDMDVASMLVACCRSPTWTACGLRPITSPVRLTVCAMQPNVGRSPASRTICTPRMTDRGWLPKKGCVFLARQPNRN